MAFSMQPEPVLIRSIEELSINAWPALQTLLYDGWVLRFADGYSRRANSVSPLYPSTRDIEEKIDACEQLYRSRSLGTTFKMTAHSRPEELDMFLAKRGYQAEAHTSVQLLDLASWQATVSGEVILADEPTETWLEAFWRMSNTAAEHHATNRQMLRLIVPQKRFASITVDGRVIACGLGVVQDGLIGLFDIITDPNGRRQGHGQRLIETLLEWGKQQKAQRGYLQVMLNNPAALALYAKLGYREAYRYWYRIKTQTE
jgi:ribosomal protein S18 acetylase RimI-like enzyme